MKSELAKLIAFLFALNFPKDAFFGISESNETDNEYELTLTLPRAFAGRVATYFGDDDYAPQSGSLVVFSISDVHHGLGEGNLRHLADELIELEGAYFDLSLTVNDLVRLESQFSRQREAAENNSSVAENLEAMAFATKFLESNFGTNGLLTITSDVLRLAIAAAYAEGRFAGCCMA